jgi:D-tyrosyl-tRNA(Tyr) deacylase
VVLQRVSNAKVTIDKMVHGKIRKGLVLLIGVANVDTEEDVNYCVNKCVDMRIFEDENNKMNRSVLDVQGEILVISQFTLLGNTRKGRRPSFIDAADPQKGNDFYELFIKFLKDKNIKVESGKFGAMMDVELTNSGPVTIIVDSNLDRIESRRGNIKDHE